ncbi:hypothetical protein Ari01nite_46240 [Paractinoplanes rishiriensis]|uniref:Novel STAND NTPase 3 domain-containing protein n=1 Tax=Paractinoplanes rishiriensis TaxID=1050105 RepID=A0A919K1L3_9ACTN|nr:hypothetical protein Ari01nite_46240 [Actinoplanes rishiriensis]
MHDFSALTDVELEQLAAALLTAELSRPVECFARGPDRGIDLRWRVDGGGWGVGQCKHYQRSSFANLRSAAKQEVLNVERLDPAEYLFVTSYDLTVGQKDQLHELFRRWMAGPHCVIGRNDLSALLTKHRDVARRHPKVVAANAARDWWAEHPEIANRASALKDRVSKALPRYVVNAGYYRARALLDQRRVCVIAGIPGIGKTMLAQFLVAEALGEGYEPVEISGDISEAWAAFREDRPQVFLYDDFLGQVRFSLQKNEDQRISNFVEKVAASKAKKFILTTREYILKDALAAYEKLEMLDQRMYLVLALEDYSRANRAKILYNHLWHSDLDRKSLAEVAMSYQRIVDHPGYSPRLVEYCTGPALEGEGADFVERFVDVLDNPDKLWRTAFDQHLTEEQKSAVVALATLPTDCEVDDLLTAALSLCRERGLRNVALRDCRFAIEVVEGTFLSVGQTGDRPVVRILNPSVTDFVQNRIQNDEELLRMVLDGAAFFEQLQQMWDFLRPRPPRRLGARATPPGLNIENLRSRFTAALDRTIYEQSALRRFEWVHANGWKYQESSNYFEERVGYCMRLPAGWRPDDWPDEIFRQLEIRWRHRVGDKLSAVRLLEEAERRFQLPADLLAAAARSLDRWLEVDLDEPEDWVAYLDRLASRGGAWRADEVLRRRYQEFVERQLRRWSPTPPHFEDLRHYAKEFGLSSLVRQLNDADRKANKLAEIRESRDVSTAALKPPVNDAEDDATLKKLFNRLIDRGEGD